MADLDEDLLYIRTINGMPPDENGNFDLVPGECIAIEVNEDEHAVTINDTCCTPCCGWSELDVLQEQIKTLTELANNLDIQTTQLNNVINSIATVAKII